MFTVYLNYFQARYKDKGTEIASDQLSQVGKLQ